MYDQSKFQKKPEAKGKAPASPPPFSSMLPPTSPTPSLSQDLEKKMHSSLKSYDANMERLSKDINEGCDRLRERFDRLKKYKRERDALDAIADPSREAAKMFPGPTIQDLTVHQREKDMLESTRRDLEKKYHENVGYRFNAFAGSWERDQTMSEKQSREGTDALTTDRKRKRSAFTDTEKLVLEHVDQMSKEIDEIMEQREKTRKMMNGRSFQEYMRDEIYPEDSEFWKACDNAFQDDLSKPVESGSDNDLGNGSAPFPDIPPMPPMMPPSLPMSTMPNISDMSNAPPMSIVGPLSDMRNSPAMSDQPIYAAAQKRLFITLPPRLNPSTVYGLHAVNLGASKNHTHWNPHIEMLEAVSDKPFRLWDDVIGIRRQMCDYLERRGFPPTAMEACRVKGDQKVRLMVFVHKDDRHLGLISDKSMQKCIDALGVVLSVLGIDDVGVEVWETDFDLMVV